MISAVLPATSPIRFVARARSSAPSRPVSVTSSYRSWKAGAPTTTPRRGACRSACGARASWSRYRCASRARSGRGECCAARCGSGRRRLPEGADPRGSGLLSKGCRAAARPGTLCALRTLLTADWARSGSTPARSAECRSTGSARPADGSPDYRAAREGAGRQVCR